MQTLPRVDARGLDASRSGPILVLGAGDVGSAVAHALHGAGFAVAIVDTQAPAHPRRGMAFADALWDGEAVLSGVVARRVDAAASLASLLAARDDVCVTALALPEVLAAAPFAGLVDALMRKRADPPDRRGLVPLAIGLGVGFVPGRNCDVAIETSWEDLGRVLHAGATLPLRGEPRAIAGIGRERVAYAPAAGILRTARRIGDVVAGGEPVATVAGETLCAPIAGALRGLVRDGVMVTAGAKVLEVDPRGDPALCFGVAERPRRIAQAVLGVLRTTG
ncbi:xanthine dehydrogenase [Falsiroseomonas oryziterrae]|uniref:xanthine dehydrogenase n=1 Tax=Falsiroseomonas oryziterrae TaxID=2911368 RepID=UPI001F1DACEA|nr:xanthine dehydrogenase [Roseomonas sp. NPKOSM-4]